MSLLDAKEQVRQAVDIVDLVGSYIQLRRQGRNYVGLCPWHEDRRPSLQVNPDRQTFKCWVCDIGGDVFSFIMQIEGLPFPEALAMLAERAGIELKPERRGPDDSAGGSKSDGPIDKRVLLKALAWAEGRYHDCLMNAPDAEPARRYLAERGISAESIARFGLGFSPTARDWILDQADRNPKRAQVLEAVGILARSESGGWYDRFKARLLFSIRDAQGRPVGMGGRVLPELATHTTPAKYVNSPETALFSKSRLLYGLDLARQAIRREDRVLVMEGYTDVIAAHQAGFENAVAVLGTALGEAHIRLLKRFTDHVVLVLDGDEAGQRRTNEILELFASQPVDLKIVTLPQGLDPCEFLEAQGANAFRQAIEEQAVDALDHAFAIHTRDIDVDRDVHAATQALEHLIALVAKAPVASDGGLRLQRIVQRIAGRFRVDEQDIRRRMAERRRGVSRPVGAGVASAQPARRTPLDAWRRELYELLVAHPEFWPEVRTALNGEWLAEEPCREIYEAACRLWDSGEMPHFDRLMLEIEIAEAKSLLVELVEGWQAKGPRNSEPEGLLRELVENFVHKETERQRRSAMAALREGRLDEGQTTSLLESILRQQRQRQGISEPTDG